MIGARPATVLALLAVATFTITISGCGEKPAPKKDQSQTINRDVPTAPPDATARPRIVLDTATLAALKKAASDRAPAYETLSERCRVFSTGDKSAGYLGLQWSEAVLSLSLCWHATGKEEYAELAIRYLTALLDDRERIGDGRGGDEEVRRNSGYPIRAHGVGAALGYDWLYNAKGMTPALRARIGQRLEAWLSWYGESGYLHDNPYANYFWGYMSSLALAGLALEGENDAAKGWLAETTRLLELEIIPGFATKLRGGAWAEGWQYGPLVSVSLAMIVRGFDTAKGVDYTSKLPWFGETIHNQLHRLHPDRETTYSNGTHRIKPSLPNATPLRAAAFVLGASSPELAAKARYIERKLFPSERPKYAWFALLASLGGDEQRDPMVGEPLSYHSAGPGLTFARSSWDRRAVWTSFQAGAKIAVDHQHNDQGHFELWRGSDGLFVDGGDTGAFATINHNTLLVDDAGRALNYPPNQGVWAKDSRTVGYADDGAAVVVVGDLAGAWDPKCAARGCKERAVKKALRTFIFVRPNVLVINDEIETGEASDRVSFAAHVRAKPVISGNRAATEVGGSRADMTVLLPASVKLRAPKEPTTSETHVYRKNAPRGDVWRIEVPSATGSKDRAFRLWMSAANRGATQAAPLTLSSEAFDSVLGASSAGAVTVMFAKDTAGGGGSASDNSRVVVVGLEAKARYRIAASMVRRHGVNGEHGVLCKLAVSRDKGGDRVASDAGSLSLSLAGCKLAP